MKIKMKVRDSHGTFLIASYLVLAVLEVFSMSLYSHHFTLLHSYERSQNLVRAFHLAESGVDLALTQLRQSSSYAGQSYAPLGNLGGYEIQVVTPDPVANPTVRLITATGHTPSNANTSYAYERRQVGAYVSVSNSPFNHALFARQNIQMEGNAVTDSYNSTTGVVGTNGDIGTNAAFPGAITLSGNADVKGDAVVGPNADLSEAIVVGDKAVIEGSRSAASSSVTLDSVQIPTNLTNGGALSVNGQGTVTMPGGTYWFSSINISGDAAVNFTGPAVVYVSGPVSLTGKGIVTSQNIPSNLLIYVQGSGNIAVAGKGDLYGAIYAPDAPVTLSGNAKFFGAVVGETISDSGKGLIRYDEALKNVQGNSSSTNTTTLLAWQES